MSGATATATLQIKAVMESNDVISNVNTIQKALKQLKMPKDMTKNAESQLEEIVTLTKQYQNLLEKPNKSNADLRQLDQLEKKIQDAHTRAISFMKDMDFSRINTNDIHTEQIDKMIAKLEKAQEKLKEIGRNKMNTKAINDQMAVLDASIGAKSGKNSKSRERLNNIKESINNGDIKQTLHLLEELQAKNNSLAGRKENPIKWADQAQPAIAELITLFEKLASEESEVDGKTAALKSEIAGLVSGIAQMRADEVEKMASGMNNVASGLSHARDEANSFNSAMTGAARSQTEMQQQVQNLQMQIKNYFGLDEIFRSIGRLAREAMDTVKELDAAMTETAVVTNFSVSDMWDMLPTYTQHANELGATISDVYNAATLYYQQGLTTSQSMALADETLKMARIGGIEAAEATDMMTAALRGFNMEIDRASAQKINDVYSKLAAITAADTKEIGSAMERTASIASSANMDFETTSAFLSQMIETTREAPENLGTAMKTIIARFQEMKVDPTKLVDSEGEAMDFNRVDKALKTIGVSLTDEQGQFRDLDDVFIEISSRWDGLTQAQQRYIATIAAGSRQQSRFIAMMQDYDRTIELVDAAYASEGAGQAQFEKTLESMDTKLNKLKNAWDQFAMGLMNADFLKKGVDIATSFLTVVEKIITGISKIGIVDPFQGIIKSALTATAVFGGLFGMSKLLLAGVGKFAGMVMGEDALKDTQGILGAVARNKANPKDERKVSQQSRVKQLKEVGKQEAEIRRQAELEAMRKLDGEGSFYSAGRTKNKTRKELNNFSKEIQDSVKANGGTLKAKDFTKSFNNLSQPVKEAVAPQIAKGLNDAFEEGVKQVKPNIDPEILAAMKKSGNLEKELANGMSIEGAARRMAKEAQARGVSLNAEDLLPGMTEAAVQQSAPLGALKGRLEGIGNSAMRAGQSIQMFAANLQGTPLEPFGNGLMLVGQGLENIGMLADGAVTKVKGMASKLMETGKAAIVAKKGEEAAASASKASTAFAGLTSSLASMWPYIAVIGAIAAACVALYVAATADERAFERQSDAAAQATQDLDICKQTLEALNNDLEELSSNDDALDSLVKGTTEWNTKLQEANGHIIEMMQHYDTLNKVNEKTGEYKYVKEDEDGRMSISQKGQTELKKEYQDAVNRATANDVVQNGIYVNMKERRSEQYQKNKKVIRLSSSPTLSGGYGLEEDPELASMQNKNLRKAEKARTKSNFRIGVHSMISDKGLENYTAIENILAERSDEIYKENATIGSDKKANKQAYADFYGYKYVGGDTFENAKGDKNDVDYETIKEQLPEMQALLAAEDQAAKIDISLTAAQESYDKTIAKSDNKELYDTEKKRATEGQDTIISDILGGNENIEAKAIGSFLHSQEGKESGLELFLKGFEENNEENQKIISNYLGKDVDSNNYKAMSLDFQKEVRDKAGAVYEKQIDSIEGAAGILDSANWGKKGQEESDSDKAVENIVKKMDQAQINMLNKTSEGMSDYLNADVAKDYATTIANLVDKGKGNVATDIQESLKEVDWSSGLSALEGMNDALEKGGKHAKDLGKSWEESGGKAMAMSRAYQDTFSSEDFMKIEGDLLKTSEEMGGLDASAIMEAAKSSSTLQRLLDATGGSAEGVARAFDLIHSEDFEGDIHSLTPSVVAAANAMNQLASSAGKADKAIEGLEIKNDSGKYADAINSQKEAVDEMINNGEYGNEGLEQALKQTFGPERWEKAYSEGKEGISKLYSKYTKVVSASGEEISKLYKKNMSVEDMVKEIKDQYKVTDEYANLLLQKAVNTDIELKRKLEKTNKKDMVNAAIQASGMTLEKKGKNKGMVAEDSGGVTSTGELKAQALLYSDTKTGQQSYLRTYAEKLGVDFKQIIKELKTDSDGKKYTTDDVIQKISEKSGHVANFDSQSTGREVNAALNDVFNGGDKSKGSWWEKPTKVEGTDNTYDLKAYIDQAMLSGATQQQSMDAAYRVALKNMQEGKKFEIAGQEVTKEDLADPQTFYAKFQEAIDNAQWVQVGETIGQEIVKAMQGAEFMKHMEKSGVTKENPYDTDVNGKGIVKEDAIKKVWEEAKANTNNASLRKEAMNEYLKGQSDNFNKIAKEDQATTINNLVSKLDKLDFNKKEIADAVSSAIAGEKGKVSEKDIKGEDGSYGINWEKTGTPQLKEMASAFEKTAKESATKGLTDVKGTAQFQVTGITMGSVGLFSGISSLLSGGVLPTPKATGQNNHRLGTFARGSRSGYTIPGRPTLTGEEGEELVWEPKRNEAYMVGSNGPQFANISKDAVVWNAEQTKRIKKNSGVGNFGLGSRGINNFGTMNGGTSKGGTLSLGNFVIPATAQVQQVVPPKKLEKIPVIADLKIKKDNQEFGEGKIKSLFGGGKGGEGGPSINVAAKITKTTPPEKDSVKPINVPGKVTSAKPKKGLKMSGSVKATARVGKVTRGKKISGEPIKIKATIGKINAKDAESNVKDLQESAGSSQSMKVSADTDSAETKVDALISKFDKTYTLEYTAHGPDSVHVPVYADFKGPWRKTLEITKSPKARGQNYQKYNSYAGGRNLSTSKIKNEMALTGEEGYEVVWMPRQNKSMIVGMEGPQMVNLPPDAVVWPHDQSKKILKNNKGIPTGTHAKGSKPKNTKNKERKKAKKGYKAGVTTKEGREANFFGIVAAIESSEKKIEKWSKTIDKAKDAMDRYSKQVGNSTAKIDKEIGKQAKYLAKQLTEANTELKNAKKATAKINNSQKKIAVSYDLDSAKNSPSREFRIKQGSLVNRSKKTGELSINEKYIRSLAKRKGKTAFQVNQIIEQLRSEAQSLVDEYNGHIESSKDLQDEVKQKQQDLRDSIKEMFYDFERSLTKIKKLQDQIATTNSFESIITSAQSLLENQIKAGYKTGAASVKEYMSAMQDSLTNARLLAQRQSNLIGASITNIKNNISTSDEKTRYDNAVNARKAAKKNYGENSYQYQKALSAEEYYKNEYEKSKLGSQYVFVTRDSNGAIQVNFDEAALGEKWGKGSENYNAVVEYYDKVLQSVQDMNQAYADLRESIAGQYQKLTDTYSEMDGFAKTIISGMEENEQETIDSLKTLNDSLRDAFNDLIDSVRKELEKQRREEQNKKTEEDISDKMNRLAMLRADTAGSNAAEIAKLEKEITDATGDYEDSLEDQLLDRLQDDADEAAEQRERQISILEDQLEYTKAIGQYVTKAENLVRKYMNGTATAEEKAELRNYYMLGQNGKDPMTIWGKEVAKGEFEFASMKMLSFGETIANITKTIEELNKILKASPTYGSGGIGNNISSRITQALAGDKNKTLNSVLKEMKKGGVQAKDLLGKKYTDQNGNTKTISLKDLKGANYSNSDLRAAGATAKQMRETFKLSPKQLKEAGYSKEQILGAGYSTRELLRNGYTGQEIQNATGRSGESIQKAVKAGIKAGDKGVTQSDLGGVSETIDTNGKKKGGKTTAHFSTSGKSLVAAQGSTLYVYDPNTKKLQYKIPISKLKSKTAQANKAEAKQAIEYAIKHKKPGSKINENMKALISATGIAGKTYKLTNGRTGSLSNSGILYYDSAGGNVYKWNLNSGKNTLDKYSKKRYLNIAKKNNNISREYAQALITRRKKDKTGKKDAGYSKDELKKKGVKKFVSGGLADYTGPAWMDGTPSKPELVLNATDTKNFMALKDVLAEADKHGAFNSNTSDSQGDTVFDININVDKIDSDYDVDQVAKRVEKIITTKAKNRNVTVVGRSR